MTTILSFIVVLGIIVFVHELGHFLAAKATGMKVETFSLGFGRKIIGKTIGDTDYRIAWIPLGGYVKISGMVDESLDPEGGIKGESYEFESKNIFQKMFVISAGVIMNFLLAIVIYSVMTFSMGISELNPDAVVGETAEGFPAQKAGLVKNDKIIAINDITINSWKEMSEVIHANPEKELIIKILRNETETIELKLTTQKQKTIIDDEFKEVGLIGISPNFTKRDASIMESISQGLETTWGWTKLTTLSLKMLIVGDASVKDLGGPIMIAEMSGRSAEAGIGPFFAFIAFISISIGFLNILPIPVLDGGHLVYIIIEGITRRKININIKLKIQQVGMALLLVLMVFTLFNDVDRFMGKDDEIETVKNE